MTTPMPVTSPASSSRTGFSEPKAISDETARLVDVEVHRIIDECHEEARRLLGAHRKALDALVQALLARETLGEEEILEVTGLPPAPALAGAPIPAPAQGR